MPKLFLHVGLPKTATTTIQDYLSKNAAQLAQQGWLYPQTARQYVAHHPIGNFFRSNTLDWALPLDKDKVKTDLLAEVKASGCDNVIMSTESLASAPWRAAVKKYFSEFEVYIVFFLRRQDRWLESAYQEEQKGGLDDMSKEAYLESRAHWLGHYKILSDWAEVFGSDHVRVAIFEKQANNQSIEQQFMALIGAPVPKEIATEGSQNISFSRDCLAFFMNMNQKRRIGPKYTFYARILREFTAQNPDPPEWKNVWSPAERRALIETYKDSNEKVARAFCGFEDGVLFQEDVPSETDPWEEYPGLTAAKAVLIGEFLADGVFAMRKKQQENEG